MDPLDIIYPDIGYSERQLRQMSPPQLFALGDRARAARGEIPPMSPRRTAQPKPRVPVFLRIWLALCFLVAFVAVVAHFVAISNGTPVHIEAAVQAWVKVSFWLGVVLLPWPILGAILRGGR